MTAARVGRPPLTDRARLLAAAREHGFVDLSVGVVTKRCDVAPSTFYRHYTSVDSLVGALVDEVMAECLPLPDVPAAWRPHLRRLAEVVDELLVAHPGLRAALADRVLEEPALLAAARSEACAAVELAGGSPIDAQVTVHAVLALACDPAGCDHRTVGLVLDGLAARLNARAGGAG